MMLDKLVQEMVGRLKECMVALDNCKNHDMVKSCARELIFSVAS